MWVKFLKYFVLTLTINLLSCVSTRSMAKNEPNRKPSSEIGFLRKSHAIGENVIFSLDEVFGDQVRPFFFPIWLMGGYRSNIADINITEMQKQDIYQFNCPAVVGGSPRGALVFSFKNSYSSKVTIEANFRERVSYDDRLTSYNIIVESESGTKKAQTFRFWTEEPLAFRININGEWKMAAAASGFHSVDLFFGESTGNFINNLVDQCRAKDHAKQAE